MGIAKKTKGNCEKKFDFKALNAEFIATQNNLAQVKNTDGLGSVNANEIKEYFKTARSKALTDRDAELQFHRFDQNAIDIHRKGKLTFVPGSHKNMVPDSSE